MQKVKITRPGWWLIKDIKKYLKLGEFMETTSFDELAKLLPEAFLADRAGGTNAVVQIHLTGERAGDWTLTIKDKQCSLVEGIPPSPRLTLTADSGVMVDIFTGKMDGVRAFMMGKLKVSGDMYLAEQLVKLFKLP
jgi:putative sterol carrier protein